MNGLSRNNSLSSISLPRTSSQFSPKKDVFDPPLNDSSFLDDGDNNTLQKEGNKTQAVKEMEAACKNGDIKLVESMYKQGVNLDIPLSDHGKTSVHLACENGNKKLLRFLLKRFADVEKADDDHKVPLHYASQRGHLKIVQYLHQRYHANLAAVDQVSLIVFNWLLEVY